MDQTNGLLETLVRLRKWTDEGQDLLGSTIPSLIQECDRAWEELRQLRQGAVDDQNEIATLRERLEQVTRERAEIAEATATCLREINRITEGAIRKFDGTEARGLLRRQPKTTTSPRAG